ncbi:hypothetical protein O3M35_007280 [Rhynocoris fuscipes]|uniref:Uncharacterized protein n=1 Tax=Rhynocoris fuscipes TaxID=488301 RepID=A0AAW1D8W1_9HEMI
MAVSPDPRILMQPDPNEVSPMLSNKVLPAIGAMFGILNVLCRRGAMRRPLLSGRICVLKIIYRLH